MQNALYFYWKSIINKKSLDLFSYLNCLNTLLRYKLFIRMEHQLFLR